MPGSLRSDHELPPSVLRKTPELSVKTPLPSRLPEKLAATVPSSSATTVSGWPSVRGGVASRLQVAPLPAERSRVTWMPPSDEWATLA